MRNTAKIFVQLASYRDPQLPVTISDMLAKAKYPDLFNFGICWQYDKNEDITQYDNRPNFRSHKHHYSESQGLGWARARANELYDGEGLLLQLDSHHRFAPEWDARMLEDYYAARELCAKPILSTYLTPFEPEQAVYDITPCLMSQYEFSADKLLMSRPSFIQDYQTRKKPIRARTLSGHFLLTRGIFCQEVPYDPDIYFGGYTEETTMSARAFTAGYDVYSPYRQYIWHEYTRNKRPKHWEDHGVNSSTQKTSGERDSYARNKTRQLFGQEEHGINMGKYGLGKTRSLRDYESFAGFDFKRCLLHDYTLKVGEPPNPVEWAGQPSKRYNVPCVWDLEFFSALNFKKPQALTLGLQTESGNELYRHDFTIANAPEYVMLQRNSHVARFQASTPAAKLVMYLFDADREWSPVYEKRL